jgi:hypothetical protein
MDTASDEVVTPSEQPSSEGGDGDDGDDDDDANDGPVYVAGADLVEAAEKQQWDRLQVRRPLEAFFASSVVRREPSCWGLVSRRARRTPDSRKVSGPNIPKTVHGLLQ